MNTSSLLTTSIIIIITIITIISTTVDCYQHTTTTRSRFNSIKRVSMSSAPSSAVGGVALVVSVEIDPVHIDEFKQVIAEDAAGSRDRENGGCYRFDVVEVEPGGNKFIFYEVYKDEAAITAHKATPHFKLWSDFKAKYSPSAVLSQSVVKGNVVY